MENRVSEIQKVMHREDIAAAIFRLPENVVLFSHYWPRNGFAFVFIPAEGEAHLIAPKGDGDGPNQGLIKNIKKFGWVRVKDGDPYHTISQYLTEFANNYKIAANSRIIADIDYDSCAPPLCAGEVLLPGKTTKSMIKKTFETDNIVPSYSMISEIRAIKDSSDIEKLQLCNEVAIQGLNRFAELTEQPGLREIDIAAEVEALIAKQAADYKGAAYGRAWAQVSSGAKTAEAWFAGMISSSRKIEQSDFVMLEMATVVDGYWCDLTKTTVVGQPDERQQEMFDVVERAQKSAVAAVRDGVQAGEIDMIARETIDNAGLGEFFIHITGHGLGFAYHEATPIIAPGSKEILKAGMVHSVEPGIYIPEVGGVRMEANVLVTETGNRILGEMAE
jgi:Xaa-Pro aminopeptidase